MAWKRIKENLWGNPNKGISGEPDPNDLTLENAYKTRWIWYHTILGIELLIVIIVQVAILTLLAVKL
jgi:hypothetical protein|tara:strand:+ start:554 stop:754 length:201 start_codon:yes stop_codon:yes gene_type:complete